MRRPNSRTEVQSGPLTSSHLLQRRVWDRRNRPLPLVPPCNGSSAGLQLQSTDVDVIPATLRLRRISSRRRRIHVRLARGLPTHGEVAPCPCGPSGEQHYSVTDVDLGKQVLSCPRSHGIRYRWLCKSPCRLAQRMRVDFLLHRCGAPSASGWSVGKSLTNGRAASNCGSPPAFAHALDLLAQAFSALALRSGRSERSEPDE